MKRILFLITIVSFALGPLGTAGEALDSELFPAEFLVQNRETLGLSEAQVKAMDELMQSARAAFDENKRQLELSAKDLQTLLKQDRPDDKEADTKMRAVLDREGDIKLLHLNTLLAVRRQLTIEQLAKARELRDKLIAKRDAEQGQRERTTKKLEDLRAAIHARAEAGTLPPEVMDRAREIQQLMKDGKDTEAERKVEETISFLAGEKPKS